MKLKHASEEKDIFFVLGCLNVGGVLVLGVATFFIPVWPQLIADITSILGTFGAVGGSVLDKSTYVQSYVCMSGESTRALVGLLCCGHRYCH